MRVTFLAHSGFFLELETASLLFDWWKGDLPPLPSGPLLVFASHHHEDHFRPAIFQLGAAAFLLGSSAAGVLQAVCDARQAELLRYYLEAWQGLFAPGSLQGTVQLFGMEYLALGLVVSLFLVLGLSALGPVMIFGSMMLYGLGSGLLMVQLVASGGWKTVLLALLWTGLPAAAASGCLCFFGACALQVSSRIHAYSFRRHTGGQARPGVQALLGQYLLTMVVLLPLCGAAAGLSYLGSRL